MALPEAAVAVSAYVVLKDLAPRILGPTADYLGGELRSYTEKGAGNLRRIFNKAANRAGDRLEKPGEVSPKVLKGVLDEGYVCEDELAAEYFGGVLASSRSSVSRDDRGATFIKLISQLSVYQLRMHHILYTTVRKRFLGSKPNVYDLTVRRNQLKTFMGGDDVSKALDLQKEEKWSVLFPHIISGLVREDLMEDNQMWGPADLLKKVSGLDFPGTGMVICPTTLGIELYLWAYGMGDLELEVFFDPAVEFAPLPDIRYPG